MSLYSESFEGAMSQPTEEELQRLMVEKAHDLFRVCDTEEKGFITKRDMQRLQSQLPLSPEQLEHVFDSLDDDGNGYLTLEEFTGGFGSFLGMKSSGGDGEDGDASQMAETYTDGHPDGEEESLNFSAMMENTGAKELFDDEDTVRALWFRLRKEDQEMASTFEDFLYKVSNEMRKSKVDFDTLEGALRSKSSAHDEEVKKLYEEMEHQIKLEKEKILAEEKAKERQMREEMEAELREKDRQLQEMMNKHAEMESRMKYLNQVEAKTKMENDKLSREKELLEESLMQSQDNLEESRSYINQLRDQQREEKRERAKAALKLSEGIAMERESLVKQLDMLRNVNKKLRDDKDEADTRRDVLSEHSSIDQEQMQVLESTPRRAGPRGSELERQGSVLSNYFPQDRIPKLSSTTESISEDVEAKHLDDLDDGIECDDDMYINGGARKIIHHHVTTSSSSPHSNRHISSSSRVDRGQTHTNHHDDGSASENEAQPVGSDELDASEIQSVIESASPERVFKVVFVGDSGVGKSSFIHRFCTNRFKASYSATIGVDFQIKPVLVDSHLIALQLWDTAGQERFRSITKQYFRKADGIIIMYDVTSETTFTNVRNWMTSVQEGTTDEPVAVLLGNKNDLPEGDNMKAVKMKDGTRLAEEFGALFYETSALNGENVSAAMESLARILKEREDREIEKSFQLEEARPKKKCCG